MSLGRAKTASFDCATLRDTHSIELTFAPTRPSLLSSSTRLRRLSDALACAVHSRRRGHVSWSLPARSKPSSAEFRPRREGYRDASTRLVLRSEADPALVLFQAVVPLVGLCISPDLEIALPQLSSSDADKSLPTMSTLADGATVQLMHLGDCVAGQSVSRSFTVRNNSVDPAAFHSTHEPVHDSEAHAVHVLGSEGSVTASTSNAAAGSPPEFYFVPSTGLIPANGGAAAITLVFTPTAPTTFFPYQTLMRVGNAQMHVQAEVHERGKSS